MGEKSYYLVPGKKIGNSALPGGCLEAKKDYLEIDAKYIPAIKESLEYLTANGIVVNEIPKSESSSDSEKSEKRLALEAEATELGIDFTGKTTQKELAALIEAAKSESSSDSGDGE